MAQGPTEQSFRWVWMQPEWSFWTQQPESRSKSRSRDTSCSICSSFRMQGENLAPRWIKSIWGGGRECAWPRLAAFSSLPQGEGYWAS